MYEVLTSIISIVLVIFVYLKWKYTYWEKKKIPFLQPRMLFGNIQNPFTRNISPAQEYKLFYNTIKSKQWGHAGIYSFSSPVYVPVDLEYIKHILVTDFNDFDERGRYYNEKDDPVSAHLFNLGGTKWKLLRKKFTPSFSTAKLKTMFGNLLECGDALQNTAEAHYNTQEPIEIKRLTKNFTLEVIGLCVFGVRFNAFQNSESEIIVQVGKFLRGNLMEAARMVFTFSFPNLSHFLKIPRYDKNATGYFTSFIKDLVSYREIKNLRQHDFLQVLIDLKNSKTLVNNKEEGEITMEQLISQCMIFLVAGYDSSASTVALAMFELSVNPEIQEKVRNEVFEVINNAGGTLTYESMGDLKYMQQVIQETLRKYPPLAILNRQSSTNYRIPNSNIVLDKGTPVIISLLGLHYDPEYFPNPDKFDPERFSEENISQIKPFSYLPFGEGPKGCLGIRFGMLKAKLALCILLKNYRFSLNKKTVLPFQHEMGILNSVKGGIWLNMEKYT